MSWKQWEEAQMEADRETHLRTIKDDGDRHLQKLLYARGFGFDLMPHQVR